MDIPFNNDDEFLSQLAGFRLDLEQNAESASIDSLETLSKPSWTANPILQLAAVGTATGAVALGLNVFVGTVTNTHEMPEQQQTDTEQIQSQQAPPKNNIGDIKTSLTFGEQSDEIAALADVESSSSSTSHDTILSTAPHQARPQPVVVPPRPPAVPPTPVHYAPQPLPVPPPVVQPSSPPATTIPPEEVTTPVTPALPETPVIEAPPETPTSTVASGTRVRATVETATIVARGLVLSQHLRLQEPLPFADGKLALPANTILIAEITGNGSDRAYYTVTGYIHDGEEHDFPAGALLALGPDGPFSNPNAAQVPGRGLNIEQAILTGALDALDLDQNDLLTGTVLDILGQLTEQQTLQVQQALEREDTWVIPADTEIMVYVNQAVQLPVEQPVEPKPPATPPDTEIPYSMAGFSKPLASTVLVELYPDAAEIISFLQQGERIVSARLDNKAMATLTFDRPFKSGSAQLIHIQLKDGSTATSAQLDIVTESPTGKRQWHQFTLVRG